MKIRCIKMGKTSLRIGFMNSENLFSPGQNFYGSEYTPKQYAEKVDWIGKRIADLRVHVCAFTEIGENANTCLQDVMNVANREDTMTQPPFSDIFPAEPAKGSTKIRVAIMSRFPLSEKESLVTYPTGFKVDLLKPETDADNATNWITIPSTEYSRPVGKAKITPPKKATPFNLFVVHLKSKRAIKAKHDNYNEAIGIARSAIRRNLEAAALRYYLNSFLPAQYQADPKVPTILMGDFNDVPNSVPVENISGPFDKNPGPSSPWTEPDKRRLFSCARLHMKKSAYDDKLFSYVHNESFTLIDQAFVTAHLPGRFSRLEVYNDHVFRHQSMSEDTEEDQQWKSMVSDHGIIVLELTRMLKS
jgi:endonuclease/exonuclease/phosphatase family metal-dependent hydrolase